MRTLFHRKSHCIKANLTQSIIASILSFAIDFFLLALLVENFNIYYLLSGSISFIIGTSVLYLFSTFWIFPNRKFKHKKYEYITFLLLGTIGLCLNAILLFAFTEIIGLYYLLSKIIAGALIFFINFALRKLILF